MGVQFQVSTFQFPLSIFQFPVSVFSSACSSLVTRHFSIEARTLILRESNL